MSIVFARARARVRAAKVAAQRSAAPVETAEATRETKAAAPPAASTDPPQQKPVKGPSRRRP